MSHSGFSLACRGLLLLAWALVALAGSPTPPAELVGEWHRVVEFQGGLRDLQQQAGPGHERVECWLRILPDGRVDGSLGGAQLTEGRLAANRGWLGRLLHAKTDWVVKDGRLSGAILPGDSAGTRQVRIPFNVQDGSFEPGAVLLVLAAPDPLPLCALDGMRRVD
ncbi:MAG: hypothetical protein WC326_05240 [Candidatus Delongbacteria bacterium]